MSKLQLYIDIRSSDEVLALRFDPKYMDNYYNIPMNMIRFNREVILKHLEYVDKVYIVCNSGNRSSFIKDKYFKDEPRIVVDKALSFKDFKLGQQNIKLENGNEVTIWTTGNKAFNMYNMTRVVQVILGTVMLLCGLLLIKNKNVHLGLKIVLVGMGGVALYSGITRSCFMSLVLKNVMN